MVNVIGIICMTLLLFAFAAAIAQNARSIETVNKQTESILKVELKNHKAVTELKEHHNSAVTVYDTQIADILNRLDDCAKAIGKLDAMETRIKQIDAKASDALRCVTLNEVIVEPIKEDTSDIDELSKIADDALDRMVHSATTADRIRATKEYNEASDKLRELIAKEVKHLKEESK